LGKKGVGDGEGGGELRGWEFRKNGKVRTKGKRRGGMEDGEGGICEVRGKREIGTGCGGEEF